MDQEKLSKWILVVDSDEVSRKQMEVCQIIKPPLRGVEDCSLPGANEELCREVTRFPIFCHHVTKACVPGLRLTQSRFNQLEQIQPK